MPCATLLRRDYESLAQAIGGMPFRCGCQCCRVRDTTCLSLLTSMLLWSRRIFTEVSIALLLVGSIIGALIQVGEVGAAGLL